MKIYTISIKNINVVIPELVKKRKISILQLFCVIHFETKNVFVYTKNCYI